MLIPVESSSLAIDHSWNLLRILSFNGLLTPTSNGCKTEAQPGGIIDASVLYSSKRWSILDPYGTQTNPKLINNSCHV